VTLLFDICVFMDACGSMFLFDLSFRACACMRWNSKCVCARVHARACSRWLLLLFLPPRRCSLRVCVRACERASERASLFERASVRVRVCVRVSVRVDALCTCVCACACACVPVRACACVRAQISLRVRARACVRACVRACLCVRVCFCVRARKIYVFMDACRSIFLFDLSFCSCACMR
jgi:hypothetical protein